ncbi:MAG: recombination protein RecR [Bradyrhizobiaceae bacterium]|nr:recombination protein RecR [Bradyrhizobiaceae bacterium]
MDALDRVVEQFSSLPTIGKKTARRLAFHLLRQSQESVDEFATAIVQMRSQVRECATCHTFTDQDCCTICSSAKRDRTVICVVEQPSDVLAIERTSEYQGLYHVLHGTINPLDGVGPDEIRLRELVSRLGGGLVELILALNPTIEGEVTTQYIAKVAAPFQLKLTRIARGVPVGADLEFADDATLRKAIEGRVPL